MWIVSGIFALFSLVLLSMGFRAKTDVKRLRSELEVIALREADIDKQLSRDGKKPTSAKQLPLPQPARHAGANVVN